MTEFNTNMTFGEQWRSIKSGDIGTIVATFIELLIVLVPACIIIGALSS